MFNNYIKLNPEVREKLKFLGNPVAYLYRDSTGHLLKGDLFEIGKGDYDKAYKRLQGEKGEIDKGDKVYVLPNCRIPLFKLKDHIAECGATSTGNVSEATKIIGHDKVAQENSWQHGGTVLLLDIRGFTNANDWHPRVYTWTKEEETAAEEARMAALKGLGKSEYGADELIISTAVMRDQNLGTHTSLTHGRYMTPTCAFILYHHLLNKVPIINESEVYAKIGKPIAIDESSFTSIMEMLESSDESNHKVASEILSNCDIDKSLFWIWKVARKCSWKVTGLSRFKNIRLFIEMSDFSTLACMNDEGFIEYLYNKGLLTPEYFTALAPEAALRYKGMLASPVFSIILEPSDKYKPFGEEQYSFPTAEIVEES